MDVWDRETSSIKRNPLNLTLLPHCENVSDTIPSSLSLMGKCKGWITVKQAGTADANKP